MCYTTIVVIPTCSGTPYRCGHFGIIYVRITAQYYKHFQRGLEFGIMPWCTVNAARIVFADIYVSTYSTHTINQFANQSKFTKSVYVYVMVGYVNQ